jgi:hypothetical protein
MYEDNGTTFSMVSLAAYCPEARRIAKAIYIRLWEIRVRISCLDKDDINKIMEA